MTREGYLKHKDLIEAWANGAEIQCISPTKNKWYDIVDPEWYENVEYRIKPQTIAEWLKEKLSVSEQRQNTMSQLTRGMSVPKQPFWAKPETIVLEAEDVERKRLL